VQSKLMTAENKPQWATARSLLWLLPITYGTLAVAASYAAVLRPELIASRFWFYSILPFGLAEPVGCWWGIFHCFRHERGRKRWQYIAVIVFVPLGFSWYYFEKLRPRQP